MTKTYKKNILYVVFTLVFIKLNYDICQEHFRNDKES